MNSQVIEYSSDDTAEGFLRWYRRKERSSPLSRLHETLMNFRKRRTLARAICWVSIIVVLLGLMAFYILTLYLVSYNLPSVFSMSFERLTIHGPAWCGMTMASYESYYCINGTVDVRIQNKLWFDVEIGDGSYMTWKPRLATNFCLTEMLTFNGVKVPHKSDRIYTLKMVSYLTGTSVRSDLTAEVIEVEMTLRVLGYDINNANPQQDKHPLVVSSREPEEGKIPSS